MFNLHQPSSKYVIRVQDNPTNDVIISYTTTRVRDYPESIAVEFVIINLVGQRSLVAENGREDDGLNLVTEFSCVQTQKGG